MKLQPILLCAGLLLLSGCGQGNEANNAAGQSDPSGTNNTAETTVATQQPEASERDEAQRKPVDTAVLIANKTSYMGDNSKVGAILNALKLPGYAVNGFMLDGDTGIITIHVVPSENTSAVDFFKNSVVIFALVENAQVLRFVESDGNEVANVDRKSADALLAAAGTSFEDVGESEASLDAYLGQ
ncbi:DUF4825 domain-containing protein [Peptoniphilus equinus]|uniref:DUF4825 domain-containing protein n=1 Tax=Peptoniphilus equinus TaxID=3016343 RepID=A0ABY7QSC7_9FIRM|nr:DUF4825 domain-containing protein [Peptoniphilus equinus]WBW49698.1 DUF4825 domain-containing protein [Peptoniphilus equinus]